MRWLGGIIDVMDMNLGKLQEMVRDRQASSLWGCKVTEHQQGRGKGQGEGMERRRTRHSKMTRGFQRDVFKVICFSTLLLY